MNQKLLVLACLAALAVTACNKPETAEPAVAPDAAAAPAESAPVADVAPATHEAVAAFDVKGFAGSFSGTLPCADCPGIDNKLTLNADGTFTLEETYRDRKQAASKLDGTWTAEENGKRLRLDPNSKSDEDRLYAIASNDQIDQLGADGEPAASGLTYSLKRDAAGQ
jgi:copper homeostasis protein (lipoprotein)